WLRDAAPSPGCWARFHALDDGAPLYVTADGTHVTTAAAARPGYDWRGELGISPPLRRLALGDAPGPPAPPPPAPRPGPRPPPRAAPARPPAPRIPGRGGAGRAASPRGRGGGPPSPRHRRSRPAPPSRSRLLTPDGSARVARQ